MKQNEQQLLSSSDYHPPQPIRQGALLMALLIDREAPTDGQRRNIPKTRGMAGADNH